MIQFAGKAIKLNWRKVHFQALSHDCWQETSVPSRVGISIGQLTPWQLAFLVWWGRDWGIKDELHSYLSLEVSTYPFYRIFLSLDQIRSDQSLSHVRLFATPWIAACQDSLSITNSRSSQGEITWVNVTDLIRRNFEIWTQSNDSLEPGCSAIISQMHRKESGIPAPQPGSPSTPPHCSYRLRSKVHQNIA